MMRPAHAYDTRDTVTESELHEWIAHVDDPTRERFNSITAHLPREVEFGLAAHSLPIIDEVLELTKAKYIVEFGFGAGCSAAMFLSYPTVRRVVSIDWTLHPQAIAAAHAMVRQHAGRFIFLNVDSHTVREEDVALALGHAVPDLVFIDGGHEYDTVANDIRLAERLGAASSMGRTQWLLLDDWWPHIGPGVQPAMAEWGGNYIQHRQWGNMVLFKVAS